MGYLMLLTVNTRYCFALCSCILKSIFINAITLRFRFILTVVSGWCSLDNQHGEFNGSPEAFLAADHLVVSKEETAS